MQVLIKVNNEQEEQVVKKLINAMRELDFLEDLESADEKYAPPGEQYLDPFEYRLLRENYPAVSVEVDPAVREMEFDDSNFITGTCSSCGKTTEGLIDNRPITFSEYTELASRESTESWKCESCFGA
ncbi:hypothetical protein [Brevibacillus parabrevis]|jgi:ABC-type siderophore export system, fused ATPase and permease components|uniref:hypothetical protein n=1 Tax=Brevibacillus parabrevis TaxID=54914 RepID=UPI0024904160|nr:hypothetical protein [Brevibacillus parabrevis]